ncbi:ABC transporter substrate-binding protein [Streptomyces fulvorobeus]|uniref:Peptide ABC transporter substrate-binding protein n=1 Tax=Streptomyces fulvorobeus TaxID=284028 RepID=A0A7J0C6C6_9ACTN|nr:ABC transporter substrate-binding protein [Streptomyces fulvorobeus]NYE41359.1 peptide/nickel transport system substrate-binding protein [Streptomyces fulvorobeus]GFM97707.1 peptide ABC transporter substrate-binding protein [Streptomyces fulvorobeus]
MTTSKPTETGSGFDAGVHGVVRPTNATGGTLRLVRTDDFDSLDPGNTYYAYTWNFLRLIGRTLVTFDTAPGKAGQRLVPDLAESLGESSDGGRTWTYRLREGLVYEDGSPVTSGDIKYAIARSNYGTDVLGVGPTYFRQLLGTEYGGPWREPDTDGPVTLETPDDRTLVFRLREPFAGMDLLATMPSTTPVPRRLDTGAGYATGPVATGPYRVASYTRGKLAVLEPNPYWDKATDPVRYQRASRIEVLLGVEPHEVDRMLISGEAHIDMAGFGVQPLAQERILADPELRANADNPLTGFTWIYCLSSNIAPFDNVHCRRAVQFATDKLAMQEAYGGSVGGDIATTILPPTIDGYEPFDRYPVGDDGTGDLEAARAELALAGMPDGFKTKIAARKDRLKEYRAAEALAAGLARVGIEAEVLDFPSGDYFEVYGGSPSYLAEHGIGIIMFGWGADFPDGYGFLPQIVDGRAIKERGNQNMGELDDPEINDLLDQGATCSDPVERARIWQRIDRLTMEHAVIVPYLYPRSLLYRHPDARNVFVTGSFGMYDYAALGAAGAED